MLEVGGVKKRPKLLDRADFAELKVVRSKISVLPNAGFVVANGVRVMQVKFDTVQNFTQREPLHALGAAVLLLQKHNSIVSVFAAVSAGGKADDPVEFLKMELFARAFHQGLHHTGVFRVLTNVK